MSERAFDYARMPKEEIPCNLCHSTSRAIVARTSANGLPVNTCMCTNCSLLYINPRMTKEGYDEYYMHHYRTDRMIIKGKDKGRELQSDLSRNFEHARAFGKALAEILKDRLLPGLTVDVGSSTGGILYGLKEAVPSLDVLGIEPSVDEATYANSKGVKTTRSLFENSELPSSEPVANIFCVQSLNHLLDPRGFIEWAHATLAPGGLLVLAVKNFRDQVRRGGSVEAGVQIDHVYMFTPQTLVALVESCGFALVHLDIDEGKSPRELREQRARGLNIHHIRLAAVKGETPGRSRNLRISRLIYLKTRLDFSRPSIRLHYLIRYSKKLALLRNIRKSFAT